MHDRDVMEISESAPAVPPTEAPSRLCATCANRATHTPMRCGLLHDETGRTRLCHVARMPDGPCGPDGAFWREADASVVNVIMFPGERRYCSLPKSGSFDGGGSAA